MLRPLGQRPAQAVGVHEQVDRHPNTTGPVIAKQTTHRKRARGPSGTAPSPWAVVVCLGIGRGCGWLARPTTLPPVTMSVATTRA